MELLKENLKLTETKVSETANTVCDSDVIVPDVKPDILKIMQVDAVSYITSKEISDGVIKVSGKVQYTIFYLPDSRDCNLETISTEQDFSIKLDKHSKLTNCVFDVCSDVERIDFSLLNSRKLAIKATVAVSYVISENRELSLATGIDYDNAETIFEPICAESLEIAEDYTFVVRDRLCLPSGRSPISQLIKLDAVISEPETKAITGKAVLKGNLTVSALYIDCDGALNSVSGEIPFTEIAEIFDLDEDTPCNVDYRICDQAFEIAGNAEGEADTVNFDITVSAHITSYKCSELQVLTDCFCPGAKADMLYEHIAFDSIVSSATHQTTLKGIIPCPENSPEIATVYNLFTKPVIESAVCGKGKIEIKGKVEVYVSYISASGETPIYSFKNELPLSFIAEDDKADDGLLCLADIGILHTSYNLNMSNELELRASFRIGTKLTKKSELDVISECTLSDAEKMSGIIVYFVQPGDSLWKIAKNYSVAIDELVELNELDKNATLDVGKKLIIPVC